jgi:hypothetical protein
VIFLDLAGNRYFALNPALDGPFLRLMSGEAGPCERHRLCSLLPRGLLSEGEGREAGKGTAAVVPPTGEFLHRASSRSGLLDLIAAIHSQLWCSFLLRSKPLSRIVEGIGGSWREGCRRPPGADRHLARIGASFAASSLLLPVADRCLVRALAMLALCVRRDIHPQLVFGVRANPFRAHCWLQLEGDVLIGDYEQVRLFTQIAAFG